MKSVSSSSSPGRNSIVNGGGINFISSSTQRINSNMHANSVTNAVPTPGDLPDIIIDDVDENGAPVTLLFAPDPSVTAFEALKLVQCFAAWAGGVHFSPYAFMRKMQYERHFKIL